jgi:hypothetical protein
MERPIGIETTSEAWGDCVPAVYLTSAFLASERGMNNLRVLQRS